MKKSFTILSFFISMFALIAIMSFNAAASGTSFETASYIDVNHEYTDNISNDEDNDFFKFNLPSPGYVCINFNHENLFDSQEYWYLTLYNSEANVISEYSIMGTDTEATTYKVGLNKGTYYLRIVGGDYYYDYSHRFNTCSYYFSINYSSSSFWEKENNETFQSATNVNVNRTYYGSINDEMDYDFYKFDLSSDGVVNLSFKHPNFLDPQEYYHYWIYDVSTSEIASYGVSGSKTSETSPTIGLKKGTYYLKIVGGDYYYDYSHCFKTNNYSFNISFSAKQYAEKENNESFSTATKISLGNSYVGSINDDRDYDFYTFSLGKRKNIALYFYNKKLSDRQEYYLCEIFNDKTESMGVLSVKGTDETAKYNLSLPAGTYYLRVVGGDFYYDYSHCFKTDDYSIRIVENITVGKVSAFKASQTTSTITLSWAKVSGATGYQVYKYDTAKKKYVKLETVSSNSYKVSKLKSGTTYKYAVRAYKKVNGSYYFGSFSYITTATKPGTPSLKVKAGTKKASLSWNKQTGASGYVVYMATSKNGTYKKIATVKGGTKVSYTKTGLTKGKTYYFKVRAYKTVDGKNIYGAYSAVKSGKIK